MNDLAKLHEMIGHVAQDFVDETGVMLEEIRIIWQIDGTLGKPRKSVREVIINTRSYPWVKV